VGKLQSKACFGFLPAVKERMAESSTATMVKSFLTKQVDWGEVSEGGAFLLPLLLLMVR
jgi:hypothetical protein